VIFFKAKEHCDYPYVYYFIISDQLSGGVQRDGKVYVTNKTYDFNISKQIELIFRNYDAIIPDTESIEAFKKVLAKTNPQALLQHRKMLKELVI
jgi:hypothetical protein